LAGLLAGSILLLLPRRVRWAGFVAVLISWCTLYALVPLYNVGPGATGAMFVIYEGNALVFLAFLVYGLSRLVDFAYQSERVRSELARASGVAEGLRVARDVHDFLGLGLTALALKADLVEQLIDREDQHAASEMQMMGRICAATRNDIRHVTAGHQILTLDEEVAAASEILSSVGIDMRVAIGDIPTGTMIDKVLVPVLRESVTNILRHSSATQCSIEISTRADSVRLIVDNNGATSELAEAHENRALPLPITGTGHGLLNVANRVRAAGGEVVAQHIDDHFTLTAKVARPQRGANA
jgi:two-component system, NarL family, sensor histidine kinase DesK